ncbi:minor capsid protein [Mediterraneibacter gnavus]|uniref:Phage head morphogenesis protein n=1 Tax=Mediterraneibacter gnavus TaxID=33038 RepID=A0A412NEN2_MEDGN|nr:minor capsid protein [Mediterraneibacter gnavus]RGT37011.1 phage head morphogenesis protein [Mediterraneibacter gnavus]
MANVGYINKEVAKMYDIPYSELTPEQKKILHEDSVRRAKLIKEREEAVLKNNLKAFEDEAKMEKVLASIYASCQKEILASITETIAKVQKAGGEWSYANQSALTRSRGLFEQIGEQIKALGQKEQITFRQGLSNIYTDQFLRQVYDLGQSITVKANFNRLNPALIQKTLDYPWSGAMFSDRLWQDKERLGRNLRVGLTQSMILGEGIPQITDRINKGIDTARYNAERVARTETKRVTYCAHDDIYKDTGVEELKYRCANGGDSRTCQYCRADNGKVFKRGEEPTLPRHPNCRCVYIPVVSDTFEDNELNELTGSVRGAENYEKWREAEVKKQEEVKPVEKVNIKTVEKELKENPTPVPEQIKLTDYPQVFYATKPEAKNTQALLDYMNSKTSVDPNVVALYTKMDKLCDGLSDEVVLKVTHGEHRVKRSWNRNFEYVFDVGIPKINPNYIGTYDTNLHEEMHFLDMLITVKDNKDKLPSKMFSQSYKPLVEAFDKATPVIGDRAKKLFEDFAKECDIIYKKQQETFNTQHEKIKEQYRSGKIDWKKYNSLFKKLQKEVNEEADNKRRALFGGGVSGLQDIYDAVSKGTFRDTGQVTYGHGSAYYTDKRRTNPNCSESLANYASLCVGHPELIDILAEDYPEIVTALRGCVGAMLKEVPK